MVTRWLLDFFANAVAYEHAPSENEEMHIKDVQARFLDEDLLMGGCEAIGLRPTQEDRSIHFVADGFERLSEDERKAVIKNTFAEMHQQAKHFACGSCGIACVVLGDTVYTGSVGDSAAYVLEMDADGAAIRCTRQNKELHKPTNPNEVSKIQALIRQQYKGDPFNIWRAESWLKADVAQKMLGYLALSRAIGDTRYEYAYITHEADVDVSSIGIPSGGKAFLVVASDGLIETVEDDNNKKTEEDYVLKLFNAANPARNTPEKIAKKMVRASMREGSEDNHSIIITQIVPGRTDARMAAIFDGHGGAAVSELMKNQFQAVLQQQINALLLRPTHNAAAAAASSLAISSWRPNLSS